MLAYRFGNINWSRLSLLPFVFLVRVVRKCILENMWYFNLGKVINHSLRWGKRITQHWVSCESKLADQPAHVRLAERIEAELAQVGYSLAGQPTVSLGGVGSHILCIQRDECVKCFVVSYIYFMEEYTYLYNEIDVIKYLCILPYENASNLC